MHFDVTTPCSGCPFRRHGKGAVRLTRSRVREVAGFMLAGDDGKTFSCHKTLDGEQADGGEYRPSVKDVHCAGALIFAERNIDQERNPHRMLQIAERLGLYDPTKFRSAKQRRMVFATLAEMLTKALPGR